MKKVAIGVMFVLLASFSLVSGVFASENIEEEASNSAEKSWNLEFGLNLLHAWNTLDYDAMKVDLTKDDIRGFGVEVYFLIEHAIPVVPNFKFQYTGLRTSKNGEVGLATKVKQDLSTLIQLDSNNPLSSESYIDNSHLDATLYYRLAPKSSFVQFDLGLTARYFIYSLNAFSVEMQGLSAPHVDKEEDSLLYRLTPLIYVDLTGHILDTGLSLTATGNFMAISKTKYINDWKFSAKYLIPFIHLGVELGYRYFGLKFDKNPIEIIDTNNHILYMGLYASF